ncbi:hybrid signal transduction histidine kinase E-like [Helianthus annuus]|uniref:hybrid signal transduction histidine kinase E-like n=1 Tax=Helianthus annuus TaxID=4232 RepID=UPI000B8F7468|nr:hybrid signal transduction histidine kinase E-like [Helianthus annuus]
MANATTWDDFKELMREEPCPRDEIQKLETEYYDLKMEGSEIEAYTKQSHELAILCPNLSRPPPRRIELYIKGLAPSIKSLVTTAKLNNLPTIIRLAHKIIDQEVEHGALPPRVSATTPTATLNQNVNDNNNSQNNNNNAGNNNNGNNEGNGARGRVFTIGAGDARNDGNVVTGTFSVNNLFTFVLFDFGADWSYVSLEFSQRLGLATTPLEAKHVVELADDLVGQVFEIDLLPVTLGSFDIVVSMDWLSMHQVEILCKEKTAQKCLRKGYPAILALVTDTPSEERRLEDLPVVREFSDVFPEELPGLPPYRQVEFQIDLVPGVAPIAQAPYHFVPGELQEISNQLQELLDRGFI